MVSGLIDFYVFIVFWGGGYFLDFIYIQILEVQNLRTFALYKYG